MSITISPEVAGVLLTLVVTIVGGLLGIIWRLLKNRVKEVDKEVDDVEGRLSSLEEKVNTLFGWAFGNDHDATDKGISQDIEDGFKEIHERLDQMEDQSTEEYEEIRELIENLIEEIHDDENVDIERDDIE